MMQLPFGMLLDRFSVKLLLTTAASLCSFGVLWFSFSSGFMSAFICRLMIGLGSACGFIGLMVVTLNWFPKKYFAFLIGCGQFLGAIGPLCAGAPIARIMKATGGQWRPIFLWVGIFGIVLTVAIALFFKGKPSLDSSAIVVIDKKQALGKRLKKLLSTKQVYIVLAYAATSYVALPLFGAFWGTTYLETRGMSKTVAAFVISMIWIGLAVGCPLLGKVSDLIRRRKPLLIGCSFIGLVASSALFFLPVSSPLLLSVIFFGIGLAGSGQNLSFAVMAEQAPKSLRATALGLNNTAIMGLAALLPPFVTSIIQSNTGGGALTAIAMEKGLILVPVCFAVAISLSFFLLKETYCREQNAIYHINKE